MIYTIIGAVLGLCFFIIPVWAYRKGLKDGLSVNSGKDIEPIRTPVAVIKDYKQAIENEKQTDILMEGFSNLMAYDGEVPIKAVK